MQRFTLPRDIYHGYGSMEILKNLTGKRAIICTGGGSSRRNGSLSVKPRPTSKRQAWK